MTFVLDASAILALILSEEGAENVSTNVADAHLSTVNLSEVIAKLMEYGLSAKKVQQQIDRLELNVHDFDQTQAGITAVLRSVTQPYGLSLGDRACLALGQSLAMPILTSDRRMADAKTVLGLDIHLIR